MKRLLLFAVLISASIYSFSQRTKYNFNPAWKVFKGDDSLAKRC